MTIQYESAAPPVEGYKRLLESTGWTTSMAMADEVLQAAIANSWYWVSAWDEGQLIGVGRLISDGGLYALVCDLIVIPAYAKQGIGSALLRLLLEKCTEHGVQRVWLFAAPGQRNFYLKRGFAVRPPDAPGMQLVKPSTLAGRETAS